MKKNRTRAFSILLIMSIMLVGIPYANAAIDEKYVMADNLYNSASTQDKAIEAYLVLRNLFELDENGKIIGYPDEYGGCYINNENDLVVQVKEDNSEFANLCRNLQTNTEFPIVLKTCKYSINESEQRYFDVVQTLGLQWRNYAKDSANVIESAYYSAERNTYVIQVATENQNETRKLYTLESVNFDKETTDGNVDLGGVTIEWIDQDNVAEEFGMSSGIENDENIYRAASTIVAGMPLYGINSTEEYEHCGSVGVSGTITTMLSGRKAILTAGHVADNNPYLGTNGTYTQLTPHYVQFFDECYGDYGLLYTDSIMYSIGNSLYNTYNPSNGAHTLTTITSYYPFSDYPEGLIVSLFGSKTGCTGEYKKGLVISSPTALNGYGSYTYSEYDEETGSMVYTTVNNMIVIFNSEDSGGNLSIQKGDSGGPVWFDYGSNGKVLLGIISGTNGSSSNYRVYASPLYQALQLGFVPANMTPLTVSPIE